MFLGNKYFVFSSSKNKIKSSLFLHFTLKIEIKFLCSLCMVWSVVGKQKFMKSLHGWLDQKERMDLMFFIQNEIIKNEKITIVFPYNI